MTATLERPGPGPRTRIHPRSTGRDDALAVVVCLLSALSLTWVLYERLLPSTGIVGFWLTWYLIFLVLYAQLVWLRTRDRLAVTDQVVAALVTGAAVLAVGTLALVIVYLVARGFTALRRPNFYLDDMSSTGPLDPLTEGGAFHAMVGTLEMVGLGILFSVPLGIATGIYLNEVRGRLSRVVRTIVDAMSALPSIVAGLFIFALFILTLGQEKSGLAASLALSVMMLPIITRTAEVVLRLVPSGLREASYALGAPQWRTVLFVVLPTARASLVTAVILGVARGVGETAPVLLTAGFTNVVNFNPARGQQVSLPLYIFDAVRFPQPDMIARGFGAAVVLLALVLVLFVTARVVGNRGPTSGGRRQRRASTPANGR